MIVVIRNLSGHDLFLAIPAGEDPFVIRIFLERPVTKDDVARLRPGDAYGIPDLAEELHVRFDAHRETFSVRRRREEIDRLDAFGEIIGVETYLDFTLHLLN